MSRGKVVAAVLLAAVGAAVGAVGAQAADSRSNDATVEVKMVEWKMVLSVAKVPAGKVTFVAVNNGKKKHEVVVIKTDLAPNALPQKGGKVTEKGAGPVIGEVEGVAPGQTKTKTMTLTAGKYVLICNYLRHYKRGQFAGLKVG